MPAAPMRIHVWDRCLLVQADSLSLVHRRKSHKRLAATVMVAGGAPFSMAVDATPVRPYQGVILDSNVSRLGFEARDSQLTILDAGLITPAYQALLPALRGQRLRELDAAELEALCPLLTAARSRELDCAQARALFDEVIRQLGGGAPREPDYDARIRCVMRLAEERPLDELSLPLLAKEAGVSESRLRALCQAQLGCGPAQYLRWVAAWKAIRLWRPGVRFTDIAHEVGFHDLAHIDHAMVELFGLSPSAATGQGGGFQACWM